MELKETQKEFCDLVQKLYSIGLPVPGTIQKLYARCGSKTCPCYTDNSRRHGPYLRWHYLNKDNRQCAIGIDEKTLAFIEEGIKNREAIENILEKILALGAAAAHTFLVNCKSTPVNTKKLKT
jgi:hypothetical protein